MYLNLQKKNIFLFCSESCVIFFGKFSLGSLDFYVQPFKVYNFIGESISLKVIQQLVNSSLIVNTGTFCIFL